jgi:predicted patatin/cPLA2 family phospholipase
MEQAQRFRKRWAETVNELIKRQRETTEAQFKVGVQNIEKAFQIGEVKSPEELRARTIELWQKCFEAVLQLSEAQTRDFQVAVEKWLELVTNPVPTS